MAVQVADGEVRLTGTVGAHFWEDGFTSGEVAIALAQVGKEKDVTVIINSGGGVATEGAAIHAILAGHKGKVIGRIEGIAASAASLAILGAHEVEIAPGATFMIHEVSTVAWGDAEEMGKAQAMLDTLSNTYASVYAEESGKSAAEIRTMMKAETWMTPQQAVEMGFADRVGAAPTAEVSVPAFAYAAYANAPAHLKAMATARNWTPATARAKAQADKVTPTPPPLPTASIDPAVAAEIVTLCNAAGQATLAAQLIREGADVAKATARLDTVKGVHQAVADARRLNPAAVPEGYAADLLRDGMTVEGAKAKCLELVSAAAGPEINNTPPDKSGGSGFINPALDPRAIYAKRAQAKGKPR